jgi:hypothetical protein
MVKSKGNVIQSFPLLRLRRAAMGVVHLPKRVTFEQGSDQEGTDQL